MLVPEPTSPNDNNTFRLLFFGDVVGKPGRNALKGYLAMLRAESRWPDFVIVNAENAAAGSGITPKILRQLKEWQVDVVTSGDHIFKNRHVVPDLERGSFPLLRPLNLPAEAPGRGFLVQEARSGVKVGVVNLLGRVFLEPVDCPFKAADRAVAAFEEAGADIRIVDFHAEATSEKIAMGRYLDGRVSAVLGTHTHVPTADEQVLAQGTAFITDVGMTGPYDSVLGREVGAILNKMVHGRPNPFPVAKGDPRVAGAELVIDRSSGRALEIHRFMKAIPS